MKKEVGQVLFVCINIPNNTWINLIRSKLKLNFHQKSL